jgi:serine/threonine protein kinase
VDALIPGIDPESIGDWKILYRISASDNSVLYFGSRGIAGREEAALKVISNDVALDKNTLERLQVEVDALEKLNNPNIANLVDKDLSATPAWIATEYLGRKSLETKLRQDQTPVTGIYWWELARAIFSGLTAIHSVNIAHRDIKPANIMIDGETIKIIDFGISYVPGKSEMITRNPLQFEGSRPFAAPENFGNKFTPKMDVFSAAVTLTYAAKLKSIWNDENEETLSDSIIKGSPDLSGLTPEQVEFITPLLDKYSSQRPTSKEALEKIDEYIEFIANQSSPKPIPLKGSSYLYRLTRKKSTRVTGVTAAVLISLLVLILRPVETIYIEKPKDTDSSLATLNTPKNIEPTPAQIGEPIPSPGNTARNYNEVKCTSAVDAKLYDEAITFCLEAIKENDVRALFIIATAYTYKDNYEQAEKYFKLAADKGYERSIGALALLYESNKNKVEAEKWYQKAMKTNSPENLTISALYLIRNKKYDQGENLLIRADKLNFAFATAELGKFYFDTKKFDKAEQFLNAVAKTGDSEGMFYYAELKRIYDKDLEAACSWYKKVSVGGETTKTITGKAQLALVNYCQSGNTGSPPLSENLTTEKIAVRPYNPEALVWIIPRENISVDFNFVQYKIFNTDNIWRGISYKEKNSNDNKPWLEVVFNPAGIDKCFDFRLIKVEKGLVSKIWNLDPSGCVSFSSGAPVQIR